jgi:chromosome segregation ATPase
MNIFDPHITGSMSVSASAQIEGDLTVLGTIYGSAQISGQVDSATSASHAAQYLLTSSFEAYTGSLATTGSNTFIGDQTISGSLLPQGTLTHDLGSDGQRWRDIYLAGNTINLGGTKITKNDDGDVEVKDSSNNLKKIVASEIEIGSGDSKKILKIDNGKFKLMDSGDTKDEVAALSGSFTGSFVGDGSRLVNVPASAVQGLSLNRISDGEVTASIGNGKMTLNANFEPDLTDTRDLGSPTKQWRDLFLSSGSLYINGQQVISTTGNELRITTDEGESIKIIETASDTITLQTENGDITLTSSGNGNIELDAPIQIGAGKKILSSDGNSISFANGLVITGSIVLSGDVDGVDIARLKSDVDAILLGSSADKDSFAEIVGLINSVDTANDQAFAAYYTASNSRFASIESTTASFDGRLDSLEVKTGSIQSDITKLYSSASLAASSNANGNDRLNSIELVTASFDGRLDSIETETGSLSTRIGLLEDESGSIRTTFNSYTSSNNTTNTTQNNRLTSIETKTGSIEASISNINTLNNTQNSRLGSLETFTGSLDATFATDADVASLRGTLNSYTSSNNLRNGDQDGRLDSIESFTASIDETYATDSDVSDLRGDFNTYTSSNNTTNTNQNNRLTSIETTTSSFDGRLDSLETKSGSVDITLGNFGGQLSSLDGRLDSIETFTGSLDATYATDQDVTSLRGTLNTYTSSNDVRNNQQENRISSLEGFTASIDETYATDEDVNRFRGDFNTYTSSNNTTNNTQNNRLNALETKSGSVDTLNNTQNNRLNALEIATGSIITVNNTQNGRLNSIESATASLDGRLDIIEGGLEFTGSNVTVKGDLLVKGSTVSINSTEIDLGDNIISLNGTGAANGGIKVNDGPASGSLLWDGTNDYWVAGRENAEERIITDGPFHTYTSSLNSKINSIHSTTASFDGRLDSIESFTGSLDATYATDSDVTALRGTLNSYTSSNNNTNSTQNSRLSSLETTTGSIITVNNTQNGRLDSLESFTGSLDATYATDEDVTRLRGDFNSHTSSNNTTNTTQNNRLTSIETATGSIIGVNNDQNVRLTALEIKTGSLSGDISSLDGRVDSLETKTGSLTNDISILDGRVDSIEVKTGSFETSITNINTLNTTQNNRLTSIESTTGSIIGVNNNQNSRLDSLETTSGSIIGINNSQNLRLTSLETTTGSIISVNNTQNNRLTSIENTTGSIINLNNAQNGRLDAIEARTGSYLTEHPTINSANSSNNSGRTYIQDVLLDGNGHVTGLTTASETVVNTDRYVTGATFNNGTADLTLTRNDGNTVTVRLLDTLSDVTVTGGTYNSGTQTLVLTKSDGNTVSVSGFAVDTDVNWYTTGATFNTSTGIVQLSRNDGGTVSVDLDGRYLQSYTETDPIFTSSEAYNITNADTTNWDTAFGWGNHATRGYLTAHPTVGAAISSNNSGRTYIQDILVDSYGHITGLTTATETVVNTNYYVTGATFNTSNGVVTLTRNDGSTITVDIDGKYAEAGHNHDSAYVNVGGDTMTGSLTLPSMRMGNVILSASGDQNHIHFDGSALIPLTTTTASNASMGNSGYRWSNVYSGYGNFTNSVTANAFAKIGGTSSQFLMADGSVSTNPGWLTTESDPIFTASEAYNITNSDTTNWDTAFGWGDHSTRGYLTTYTNNYVNAVSWNSSDGVITIGRQGLNSLTLDIDGRYLNVSGGTITKTSTHVAQGSISASDAHLDLYNNWESDTDQKGSILTFTDNYYDGSTYRKTLRSAIKGGTDTTGNTADGYLEFYVDSAGANSPNLVLRLDRNKNANFYGTIITSSHGSSSNWKQAYDWGDHASAGYLTAYSETDTLATVTSRGSSTTSTIDITAANILRGFNGSGGSTVFHQLETYWNTNAASSTATLRFDVGLWRLWSGIYGGYVLNVRSNGNVEVVNNVTASSFIKTGGTSTQFLKADGSVDANTYLTTHPSVSAASSSNNSGRTYIQDILLDSFGHITGLTTATETVVNTDRYVTGATFNNNTADLTLTRNDGNTITVRLLDTLSDVTVTGGTYNSSNQTLTLTKSDGSTVNVNGFAVDTDVNWYTTGATFNTGNGIITGTLNNGSTWTVDIDGRFLTAESDTLATVTSRGSSTSTALTFNGALTLNNTLTMTSTSTQPFFLRGDSAGSNGLFRIQIDDVNDSFGTGARTFLGDGGIDVFIGTSNGSYTPNNTYIALNHSGEISMGAGSATKHLTLSTSGNLSVTGTLSASGYNKSNWDTAYGWGNHASAGYANYSHKYHTFSNGDEYYDSYGQNNNLRLFTENATFDNFRFRSYSNVEYFDGTNWVPWGQSLDTLFDGREETGFSLGHANSHFRFEINRSSGWPTTALFVIQSSWTDTNNHTCEVTLETWNGSAWVQKDNWTYSNFQRGINLHTTSQTHDGIGQMRVTINMDWTDASHNYYPLRRILFLSNFSGGATDMQPFTWEYNKNVTFSNQIYVSGGDSSQWNTAYGWGNHASAGYLTSYTDTNHYTTGATFNTSDGVITFTRNNGNTYTVDIDGKYLNLTGGSVAGTLNLTWPTTSTTSYELYFYNQSYHAKIYSTGGDLILTNGTGEKFRTTTAGVTVSGVVTATGGNSSNWNTAYGWGDHSTRGYLTSVPSPQSGDWWNDGFARVGTDGVMEIGKYIDFHDSDTTTSDYNFRITNSGDRLYFSGDIELDGGDIYINDSNTRLTEGNSNALRIQTNTGYVDIGSMNSSWVHFQADRSVYMWANGGLFSFDADVIPHSNNTKNLGSSGNRWATIYANGGDSTQWNTAYGWGNHASAGYLTTSTAANTYVKNYSHHTSTNADFNIARSSGLYTLDYGGQANLNSPDGSAWHGLITVRSGSVRQVQITIPYNSDNMYYRRGHNSNAEQWNDWVRLWDTNDFSDTNVSNWNTAYGWGNHASAGYLTSLPSHNHDGVYLPIGGKAADSNLLDGIDSTSFLRSDTSDSFTGDYLGFPTLSLGIANNNSSNGYNTYFRGSSSHFVLGLTDGNTLYLNYGNSSGSMRTYGTWYHGDTQILSSSRALSNVTGNISMFTNDSGYITSTASISGNAATASKWATARTITLSGDLNGSVSIDGSANVTLSAQVVNDSHTHDDRYFTETESDARYPLSRGGLGTSTTVGDTTGWGNNLAAGTYTRGYVGHGGQVIMSHDTGGSVGNVGIEVTYYGAMYVHTNVDSNQWVTKQIWTSENFTSTNISNWNTAYGWGNHASAGYVTHDYYTTGATFNSGNGIITFTRNDGGTYTVNIAATLTDVTVTGGTYNSSNQTLTLTKSNGTTVSVSGFAIDTDVNWYTTSASFNTGNGVITGTRNDGGTWTVDIDGRFVPYSGGNMTGNLNWGTTGTGLTWTMNTDGAYIIFYNTGDGDTDSRLEYGTSDNGNEYHRWMVSSIEEMTLKNDGLRVTNDIYMAGNIVATQAWVSSRGYLTSYTDTNYYTTGATFNTGNGVITGTLNNGSTWTVDIDGRYLQSYTEVDTLASVTARGSSTSSDIFLNNAAPTLYLQDTDNRSAMIHVNSNYFYILNGNANNSTSWAQQANSRWLFQGNLNNNDITFGGSGDFAGVVTATGGNSNNWNTAYGWGNHASAGYLTAHPTIAGASSNNSGRTYIQDVLTDANGHVTGLTTATETVVNTDTNYYVNSASFTSGILTLNRIGLGSLTVSLDGRYLQSESDTLSTVTARGNTTGSAIAIGGTLTINKSGTDSWIVFPAQTNDPGYIRHYESNNTSRMLFSVSDDSGTTDYFGFGYNGDDTRFVIYSNGNVYGKGTAEFDGRVYADDGLHVRGDWVRVDGSNGIYFNSYGGGWRMTGSSYVEMYGSKSLHMQNGSIDYVTQLHFNDNVRFYDEGNNQYLNYKWGNGGAGGIKFVDGDNSVQGYVYGSGTGSFGLLDSGGNWKVRVDGSNVEMYGSQYLTNVYANVFYDRDNSAYYLNPNQASNLATLTLNSPTSGTTVFNIQGTQGQLFSITDDLTGDLFSVSDASGVPIFNVNANSNVDIDGRLIISKNNASSLTANAHLLLENGTTSSGQTTIGFRHGGTEKGSIRVDSSGNQIFNAASGIFYYNNDFGGDSLTFRNVSTTFMTVSSGTVSFPNTVSASISGNAASATNLGSHYTADDWFRATADNNIVKFYGNTRSIIYRTDGVTNEHGGGGYPHIWYYGGSADSNRVMIINTSGQLWMSNYGWLHDYFQASASAINTGNIGSQSVNYATTAGSATSATTAGYATTAGSADQIDGVGFRNTGSNEGINADTLNSNGITYYTGGVTNFSGNSTDGALYSQAYSSSWQHQIAGDYRSGQIAVRGKNNGTWQSWKKVALVNTVTFTNVTSVSFTHGLGTDNIVAQVYDGGGSLFFPSELRSAGGIVTVTFEVPRSGRLVVTG